MSGDLYDTEFLARLTIKRLTEMNQTRAKVESMERRVGALADAEVERRRLQLLDSLTSRVAALGPSLRDMGHHVAELKAYLQSVYDADLMGDPMLQQLAGEHCIGYTVRLLDLLSEPSKYMSKGAVSVIELASSTLAMFSGRPFAGQALADAGAVPVIIKLLSPLFPMVAVVNAANAMGNLATHPASRLSFRVAGGVGGLVRLLRSDVEPAAQTAAAAALSLLAARDMVVQDSVRYLGGLDLLVDLLASNDTYLAEVARYALLAMRHGNMKNQAEIITTVRSSPSLIKDVRKLEAAAELLRFEDGAACRSPYAPTPSLGTASEVRSLLYEMSDYTTLASPRPRPSTSTASHARAVYNTTPTRRPLMTKEKAASLAYSPLAFSPATLAYSPASLSPRAYSPASPSYVPATLGMTSPRSSGLMADYAESVRANSIVEVETELLRKKHLARFSSDELQMLLEEMGFDSLDLRGFRVHRVSGQSLIDMNEDEMLADLVLPQPKVRKLRVLQQAARLFDRIATLPRQGKISEIEVRLYLAGQGSTTAEVNKILRLFRTLVRTDKYDFVSFWDFTTSYDWIAQAFRIYNVYA